MKDDPPSATPGRGAETGKVLREAVIVAVMGALLAFAANAVSPRGLILTRDYFPGAIRKSSSTTLRTNATPGVVGTNVTKPSTAEVLAARLQAKGLQLVDSNQVAQLFRDPRYEQELIVFIDARDDRHYQEGHVPGAYQFDHYRAENYFAAVMPACQSAEQIVVYCTGGDCEDSEFTAITLGSAGIPKERLFVYGGGMTEWVKLALPVEIGGRKSGNLQQVKP